MREQRAQQQQRRHVADHTTADVDVAAGEQGQPAADGGLDQPQIRPDVAQEGEAAGGGGQQTLQVAPPVGRRHTVGDVQTVVVVATDAAGAEATVSVPLSQNDLPTTATGYHSAGYN